MWPGVLLTSSSYLPNVSLSPSFSLMSASALLAAEMALLQVGNCFLRNPVPVMWSAWTWVLTESQIKCCYRGLFGHGIVKNRSNTAWISARMLLQRTFWTGNSGKKVKYSMNSKLQYGSQIKCCYRELSRQGIGQYLVGQIRTAWIKLWKLNKILL